MDNIWAVSSLNFYSVQESLVGHLGYLHFLTCVKTEAINRDVQLTPL